MMQLPVGMAKVLDGLPPGPLQDIQKFVREQGGRWSCALYPIKNPPDPGEIKRARRRRRTKVELAQASNRVQRRLTAYQAATALIVPAQSES